MQNRKAISAVIATIMLLMITVALIGVFYVFSSTMASQTTSAGGQQASQLTSQLSICMQIDNIYANQVTLRNCGKGVIANASLAVTMDGIALGANTQTIQEGNSGVVNISGLWQVAPGTHSLKISNGAAFAQALVDVEPSKNGLVGSWSFDEGSGTTASDGSGSGNTGTWYGTGTHWTASGKYGSAGVFNGVDDYVNVPHSILLSSQVFGTSSVFTLEAWAYPTTWANWATIMNKATNGYWSDTTAGLWASSQYNGFSCAMGSNVDGNPGGSIITANYAAALNNWYHIVCKADGTNLKIFVNGVERDSISISLLTYPRSENTAPLVFGRRCVGCGPSFNGTIDEVRIWNTALTPDQTVSMKQLI